ncbi:MAG: sigma-70 family RNA polymerase sigma factor [Deltaproteobacteria bacterium]|nr:sigma-70 family RNA polymerase sigma factor [Deltaproteobacteria bacterium]
MSALERLGVDDARLVARCRAGDERAWAEVYAAASPTVAAFVRRLNGPDADVDDLVQQVFVELFTSIGRFRGDARLSTWLYRIAAHMSARAARTRARHRRRLSAWAAALSVGPGAHEPGGRIGARESLLVVDRALADMKPIHRTVWVMSEVEGLSIDEMAAALKTRAGTVRSRLLTARRQLGAALEALEAEAGDDEREPEPERALTITTRGGSR